MSWYRKTKLVFNSTRSIVHRPRILPESPFPAALSRFHQRGSSNPSALFSGFSPISSRNAGLGLLNSLGKTNTSACNPFLVCPKRFYSIHPVHLKPRWRPRLLRIVLMVVLSAFLADYIIEYGFPHETIPYTNRRHFVYSAKEIEELTGEATFRGIKDRLKDKILPASHPDSIRVRSIAKEIIDALQRDLSLERASSDLGSMDDDRAPVKDTVMAEPSESCGKGTTREKKLSEEGGSLSTEKGSKPMTSHLEGLNWEVLVVDKPAVMAFSMANGKIVVFTGLLEYLKTDAEIATVLGHEVAHVVARHEAEGLTKILFWFPILRWVFFLMGGKDLVKMLTKFFRTSRKCEIEADYIGMLLLASAGYDPRVAPKTYEKIGKLQSYYTTRDYIFPSLPSGKKRAQLLAQTDVMEEALIIYRKIFSKPRH